MVNVQTRYKEDTNLTGIVSNCGALGVKLQSQNYSHSDFPSFNLSRAETKYFHL